MLFIVCEVLKRSSLHCFPDVFTLFVIRITFKYSVGSNIGHHKGAVCGHCVCVNAKASGICGTILIIHMVL
jgi:hypothetical protein